MKRLAVLVAALAVIFPVRGTDRKAALRYDFSDPASIRKAWEFHGGLLMTPRTVFKVEDVPGTSNGKALVVEADSASGVLMTDPRVDLRKNPVMRWRWRVVRPIRVKPGRPEPDDQAIVIYLGDGTMIRQKCVGYRWENGTAIGRRQQLDYVGGLMQVHAECIRNRNDRIGEWIVEERDVLADFTRAYKRLPGEYFILGVGANSQYSRSNTRVEIDYIEFLPRKKAQ